MSDFLDHAQDAARQQNWLQLRQLLQPLLDSVNAETHSNALSRSDAQDVLLSQSQASGLASALSLALQILEGGDFQAKWDVAKLFPAFGAAAIDPLVTLLQDEDVDSETRWFAARILGDLQDTAAIQALITVVQEAEDDDLSAVAGAALANLGAVAIEGITHLLTTAETRRLGVQTLGQIRRSETIAPLLRVVNDADPEVRTIAIEALSSFHDPRIPPVLVAALTDPDARVRRAAIAGLGARADLATALDLVALLCDRLWDLNLQVCQQAAASLGRIGTDAAANALMRGFTSASTPLPLQLEIVRALGWVNSAIALNHLRQILDLTAASTALLPVYEESVAVLGRCSNPDLKPLAAKILIDTLESAHPIANAVQVKQAIALALGQLQQPQALEPLIHLLAEEDARLRLHTIAALRSLNSSMAHQQLEMLATCETVPERLKRGVAIALQEWS